MSDEQVIWEGHPAWRAVLPHLVKGILGAIILAAALIAIDRLGGPSSFTTWGVVLGLVGIALTVAWAYVMRVFTTYTITSRRINVRTGVLSKKETSASLDRIQNVTITQDVLDRVFRTGTLDFDTASMDASDRFRFFGISGPHAVREGIARAQEERARADHADSPV